jgi:hypothetical protein
MKESSSASVTYLHVRVAKAKERGREDKRYRAGASSTPNSRSSATAGSGMLEERRRARWRAVELAGVTIWAEHLEVVTAARAMKSMASGTALYFG